MSLTRKSVWSGGNTQPSVGQPPSLWNVCAVAVAKSPAAATTAMLLIAIMSKAATYFGTFLDTCSLVLGTLLDGQPQILISSHSPIKLRSCIGPRVYSSPAHFIGKCIFTSYCRHQTRSFSWHPKSISTTWTKIQRRAAGTIVMALVPEVWKRKSHH